MDMINSILGTIHLGLFVLPIFSFVAVLLAGFLFWRAGRRELIDSNLLFDSLVSGLLGAIIGGRILDFILGLVSLDFSLSRFLFFNSYGGFNYYGAIFGLLGGSFIFLHNKKHKILPILDLMAAPAALARSIYLVGLVLIEYFGTHKYFVGYYFLLYFCCFWALKRLEHKKRFSGFFIAFYLIFTALIEIILSLFNPIGVRIANIPVNIIVSLLSVIFGLLIWFTQGNAKKKFDLKSVFALILLSLFKAKRVFTSLPEADELAKSIVILPYTLAKLLANFVKLIVVESVASMVDLSNAFGFKKKRT